LLTGIRDIAAGSSHSCAVLDDGSAACWGSGHTGERGDGLFSTAQTSPVGVLSGDGKTVLKDISQISTGGGSHTCVRFSSTWLVSCWGANADGELGNPTAPARTALPVPVAAGVRQISAGYLYTCAVLADGRASCWGDGNLGELGVGSGTIGSNVPLILSTTTVTDISAGDIQTCAVTTDTGVQCWGTGFLGNGTDGGTTSFYPVDVLAGSS
jgi:alpha-tubulin suppressor-like RCC1 family protein